MDLHSKEASYICLNTASIMRVLNNRCTFLQPHIPTCTSKHILMQLPKYKQAWRHIGLHLLLQVHALLSLLTGKIALYNATHGRRRNTWLRTHVYDHSIIGNMCTNMHIVAISHQSFSKHHFLAIIVKRAAYNLKLKEIGAYLAWVLALLYTHIHVSLHQIPCTLIP